MPTSMASDEKAKIEERVNQLVREDPKVLRKALKRAEKRAAAEKAEKKRIAKLAKERQKEKDRLNKIALDTVVQLAESDLTDDAARLQAAKQLQVMAGSM